MQRGSSSIPGWGNQDPTCQGMWPKKSLQPCMGGTEKRQRSGEKQGGATALCTEAGRTTDAHRVKGEDEGIPGGVDSKRRGTDEAAGRLQRP